MLKSMADVDVAPRKAEAEAEEEEEEEESSVGGSYFNDIFVTFIRQKGFQMSTPCIFSLGPPDQVEIQIFRLIF